MVARRRGHVQVLRERRELGEMGGRERKARNVMCERRKGRGGKTKGETTELGQWGAVVATSEH